MKRKITQAIACLLAVAGSVQSQTVNPAPYCQALISAQTKIYNNRIKDVNIGTLSNSTGTNYLNGSEYAYYSNLNALSIQKGTSVPATITVTKNDMELNLLWVFIDHNMNNTFEQTELVGQGNNAVANGPFGDITVNLSLTIPSAAQVGQTRMRIIYTSDFFLAPGTTTACNSNTNMTTPSFYYGETEDYNVNITGPTVVLPVASFTSPVSVCKNQNVTLSDNSNNAPTAWSWTLTGATPSLSTLKSPAVKYVTPGTYTIAFSCSNAGGPSSIASKTISVAACTGIEEEVMTKALNVQVFPNPSNGYFSVKSQGRALLVAYNLIGKKLLEQNLEEGENTVDLSAQATGVYFVVIQQGKEVQSIKLLKE